MAAVAGQSMVVRLAQKISDKTDNMSRSGGYATGMLRISCDHSIQAFGLEREVSLILYHMEPLYR